MAVKVGNLVTDEKNVQEVLSVEDGEAIASSIRGGGGASSSTSSGGSTTTSGYSFSVTNGDMIVVGGCISTSSESLQGVIIKSDGTVKGFAYSGGTSVTVALES